MPALTSQRPSLIQHLLFRLGVAVWGPSVITPVEPCEQRSGIDRRRGDRRRNPGNRLHLAITAHRDRRGGERRR